jgi:hypothetical protein
MLIRLKVGELMLQDFVTLSFTKIVSSQLTGDRLHDRGWIPRNVNICFSHLHIFQTGSGAHPASYAKDIGGSFLEDKVAGSWG